METTKPTRQPKPAPTVVVGLPALHLVAGRADQHAAPSQVVVVEPICVREELASGGLTPDQVQPHLAFMRSDYYIVFSPQTAPALVERWRGELDGMRRDGSLEGILQRRLPAARGR